MTGSCRNNPETGKIKTFSREELLQINRESLSRETALIHAFITRNNLTMNESPTGLRYFIYHDDSGATALKDQLVTIRYQAYLLDSTHVSGTPANISETFRVGHDNVVSGLHEAVKLLSVGDSATLILPSHLAYGLTGSVNIPRNSPIVYDIEVLDIK